MIDLLQVPRVVFALSLAFVILKVILNSLFFVALILAQGVEKKNPHHGVSYFWLVELIPLAVCILIAWAMKYEGLWSALNIAVGGIGIIAASHLWLLPGVIDHCRSDGCGELPAVPQSSTTTVHKSEKPIEDGKRDRLI